MRVIHSNMWKRIRVFPNSTRCLRKLFSTNSRGNERISAEARVIQAADASGWSLEYTQRFDTYDLNAFILQHDKTGAKYVHLDSSNLDNVFMVSFATPPENSTGVAHILEHLALCGSQKFPVRDPFFRMIRRSLNTFMNAMTASDHTMYPFSTQNSTDYDNLLKVYLDAVFFPTLHRIDFLQEGHRLEPKENDGYQIQGVVFNEMKGAMSDPSSIFYQQLHSSMFPTTTYHHNSGGEPLSIPTLSYEELCKFHSTHYHPSNSCFYSYGDLTPPLEYLNEHVLSKFDRISKVDIPLEQGLRNPSELYGTYPENPLAANPMKQSTMGLGYLCGDSSQNTEESVAMRMMSILLLEGPSSPMYQSLLLPGHGSSYSPGTGYSMSARQDTFSVGLSEIDDNDVEMIEKIIDQTCLSVAEKGFQDHRIDAVVHQVELSSKEIKSRFGLNLGFNIVRNWLYNGDLLSPLKIVDDVKNINEKIKSGEPVMEDLMEKYITKNERRVKLVMKPSPTYFEDLNAKEMEMVRAITKDIDEDESLRIAKESKQLRDHQLNQHLQDCSMLPTLDTSDIPIVSDPDNYNFTINDINGVSIQANEQPTNGIVYLRCRLDVSELNLTPEEHSVLPLFSSFITELGTGDKSYQAMSDDIDLHTAGVSCSVSASSSYSDTKHLNESLTFSGACLHRNFTKLLSILQSFVDTPRFDEHERIKSLLLLLSNSVSESLTDSGHIFAMNFSEYRLGAPVSISKQHNSGISYLKRVSSLAESREIIQNVQILQSLFVSIAHKISCIGFKKVAVNADSSSLPESMDILAKWDIINRTRSSSKSSESSSPSHSPIMSLSSNDSPLYISLPIQVNHAAMSIPTVPFTHVDHGKLRILSTLLSSAFLHREIREIGGAYGGGATHSFDGVFSFYSYRDPNCDNTITAFKESISWVTSPDSFNATDIKEAQLRLFSSLDSPISPGQKGLQYFNNEITKEMSAEYRQRLLEPLSSDDLQNCAVKHLIPYMNDSQVHKPSIVVVGNNQNPPQSDWDVKTLDELKF